MRDFYQTERVILEVVTVDGSNKQGSIGGADGSNDTVAIKGKVIKKTKGNYCFPDFLGKAMSNVGQRVQYESSLLSMAFILTGIVVMALFTILGTDLSSFVKIMTGVNCMAAFIFLSSSLITTFQQYQSYLTIMGIMDLKGEDIT